MSEPVVVASWGQRRRRRTQGQGKGRSLFKGRKKEEVVCDGTMHNESIYNLIPPAEAVIEKPVMHRSMVRVLDAKELWWCCEREREREREEKKCMTAESETVKGTHLSCSSHLSVSYLSRLQTTFTCMH